MARKTLDTQQSAPDETVEEAGLEEQETIEAQPVVDPATPLPVHDGTTVAWPHDEQAWAIHELLAGRTLFSWAAYPERRELVIVTHPDGQKHRIPYAPDQE